MVKWLKNISHKEIAVKVFLAFLVAQIVCCGGCSKWYNKYNIPEDNYLEEHIEDIIEEKLGVKIDITENTREEDTN